MTRDLDFTVTRGQIQPSVIYRLNHTYEELPSHIRRDLDRIRELQEKIHTLQKSFPTKGRERDHYQVFNGTLFHSRHRPLFEYSETW